MVLLQAIRSRQHAPPALNPRRRFLAAVVLGVVANSRIASAQSGAKSATVGWLSGGFAAEGTALVEFKARLSELGYVVGRNLRLEVLSTQRNESEEYPRLAARLVAKGVEVILAANPHALAAVTKATASIPIVGVDLESDPVAEGWVASLAHPGRNATGFFLDIPEMSGKQLQFLKEITPGLNRVAVLGDPRINALQFRATEAAARATGTAYQPSPITTASEIPSAIIEAAAQHAGGLLALTSPLVNVNMKRIAAVAMQHRMSSICGFVPSFAQAGGLLAYGPDFADLFRRAADYVVTILKGTAPASLPVQRPTKFQLVVNQRTASAIGLKIPPPLLTLADKLVE